jgi:hypothetical protein
MATALLYLSTRERCWSRAKTSVQTVAIRLFPSTGNGLVTHEDRRNQTEQVAADDNISAMTGFSVRQFYGFT